MNIGIFGFGNMGQAIFDLLKNEKNYNFLICDFKKINIPKVKFKKDLNDLIQDSDLIFICVKPQNFKDLEVINAKNKTIISIMAGITLKELNSKFKEAKIVRSMPNLPLQIGEGVIAWYYDKSKFNIKESNKIRKIFAHFGEGILVKNEAMLDSITALSGSGPAYVFIFINALIKAAINLGFNIQEAKMIVNTTVSGSLDYYRSQDLELSELIQKITSKKGTTEAAIQELNLNQFYKTWERVIKKAQIRAQELSK